MSIIQILAKSRTVKIALLGFLISINLSALVATAYIRFDYAAVMPRSPEPETGRIYPLKAQNGGVIYVNKRELDLRNFIVYDLTSVCVASGLLLLLLGMRLGWFGRQRKIDGNRTRGSHFHTPGRGDG